MRASLLVAAATATLAVGLLGGCSATQPQLGLVSAKESTIALEQSISEYLPNEHVITTHVTTHSAVIYPCLHHANESYWPGSLRTQLKPGVDQDAVLEAIANHWSKQKGWTVTRQVTASQGEVVDLRSNTGELFTVQFADATQFQIKAVSSCFANGALAGKSDY